MYERCKINEKMKLKRKTKTAKNVICAEDDGTKYRPWT